MGGWKRRSDPVSREKKAAHVTTGSRGGLSHKSSQEGRLLDPSCELEVLKCIMLREGYLARVTRLAEDLSKRTKRANHQSQCLPAGMVDLLDLLRVATLDTVEAISLWRLSQATPAPTPFQWNGHNYLTKMLQDCDFLDRVEALRSWLGFRISGNPFFFPQQTTLGDKDGNRSIAQASSKPRAEGLEFDKIGMADVGRQPWSGPLELEAADDSSDAVGKGTMRSRFSKKRRLQRGRAGNTLAPYAAAIINDQTLLPKLPSPTRRGDTDSTGRQGSKHGAHGFPATTQTIDTDDIVPNLVSREDAKRIEVARRALIEEQVRVREAATEPECGKPGALYSQRRPSKVIPVHSRAPVPAIGETTPKQRLSDFENRSSCRKGSTNQAQNLDPRDAADVLGEHGMPSMVRSTAGLLQRPPPRPHPALGPVLLQSDRPGGELHPNPFLHTVVNERIRRNDDMENIIGIAHPTSVRLDTRTRCSTAPTRDSLQRRRSQRDPDPSLANQPPRPATALARIPAISSRRRSSSRFKQGLPSGRGIQRGIPVVEASCPGGAVPQEDTQRSSSACSRRMLGLSRKAGAEVRALTAAGTTGRRQPPIREDRLRRLARDVVRYSAELRRLVVEEEELRKSLVRSLHSDGCQPGEGNNCRGVMDTTALEGDRAFAAMVGVKQDGGTTRGIGIKPVDASAPVYPRKEISTRLEGKRHEIEWKMFCLSIKRDELRCLRIVQKQGRERKHALEMERKRAHLDAGQKLPEDEEVAQTLEDSSCNVIQKRARGIAGRKYAAWYKGNIQQAATTIQRGVRFIWDRRATRRRLLLNASARPMQATIRMFVARQRYKRLLRQRREFLAACKLQIAGRGMLGRRRASARRLMIAAATKALSWVSLEKLQPRHLKELAHAIHGALVDPVRQFPPAGVLGALRAVLTILDDDRSTSNNATGPTSFSSKSTNASNSDTVTFQTALGRTVQSAISAPDLTWEMAARVLGRPFRLLRRMRAFASGLGASSDASPARLIHLSPNAAKLLSAYRSDPSWSTESLSAMERGGTAAKALIGWATQLEKVYREQPRVQKFLRDAQPAWLRKSRSFQKRRRALELHVESCRQAVVVAKGHLQQLESQGRAYGDPLLASEVLERHCEEAEGATRDLERKRRAFLAVQAKVKETAGKALRDGVEFAEREASVAAREEEMAIRLGQSGPEELEDLAGKTRDCGVIVRELLRRMRVWERRCEEEDRPLLDEWIPPTEEQKTMSRALGEVRAWERITAVQKARLIEDAGGRRFVKGLTGKDMDLWTGAIERLEACRADIESRQARLAENVAQFELELSQRNAEIAAEKVSSAPWDNATEETRSLERQEDADAARDELRTAMGATLPPGMLGNSTHPPLCYGRSAGSGSSRRPTLMLLGLDLPASVRNGIRASLDRDSPGLFDLHVVGAEALPSLASASQATAGRGFLEPCREQSARATKPPFAQSKPQGGPIDGSNKNGPKTSGEDTASRGGDGLTGRKNTIDLGQGPAVARSRANLVQTALSAGGNVSLEVIPGPGLWARGRFLRDLEALLGGLDDGDCDGIGTGVCTRNRVGPTVLVIDGHGQNRSGGGSELSHGTKFAGQRDCIGNGSDADCLQRQGPEWMLPAASLAARRLKLLMEEAAQRLHDLSTIHSEAPWPFKAISSPSGASLSSGTPKGAYGRRPEFNGADSPRGSEISPVGDSQNGQHDVSVSAKPPGIDLLLAACHIILHPDRRYYVGEGHACRQVVGTPIQSEVTDATAHPAPFPTVEHVEDESAAFLVYASRLAATCRKELAERPSPRTLAEVLRRTDVESIPLETAVALRYLRDHPNWPATSARSDFVGCPVSEAFIGWIAAAVAAGTELALEGGGGKLKAGEDSCPQPFSDATRSTTMRSDNDGIDASAGNLIRGSSNVETDESDLPRLVKDAQAERQREQMILEELEKFLIDESISVLDDDSPWSVPSALTDRGGETQAGRQCRASEVLHGVLNTVLRPFKVFEVGDCTIAHSASLQPTATASPRSAPQALEGPVDGPKIASESEQDRDRFSITLSRAFGSVYARAVSLGTGRIRKGHTIMARTKEEDLIPLLSPNWMEKHDLSTLRELRTEPAVWRALVDTLALSSLNEAASGSIGGNQSPCTHALRRAKDEIAPSNFTRRVDRRGREPAVQGSSESKAGLVDKCPVCNDDGRAGVLTFRHERRLTLETSCLLMGRVVPVSVYEECRSDFWCEAHVPAALTSLGKAACPTEMRVPKECIPLILDDNHPMRMQTILDASDLRHLSVLIADRLKLCRLGSARIGPRSYRHWLEGAIDRGSQTDEFKASVGSLDTELHREDQSRPEFKLSLRKRSVGQVVFSRLVSFWVPSSDDRAIDEAACDVPCARSTHNGIRGDPNRLKAPAKHIIQRLIIVKEFSHRGECGELRGEIHDFGPGGQVESFVLAPRLTRTLLEDWRADLKRSDKKKSPSLRYWRNALTWRLRIVPQPSDFGRSIDVNSDESDFPPSLGRSTRSSCMKYDESTVRVTVDGRMPLCCLRRVAARLMQTPVDDDEHTDRTPAGGNHNFDVLILPVHPETDSAAAHSRRRRQPTIEFVAMHRRTMAVFSFTVPVKVFTRELDAFVAACLTAPTALSTELELPSSSVVLRALACKWLLYSPGEQDSGHHAILTLSFAEAAPITAEPDVGLRRTRRTDTVVRGRGEFDRHATLANDDGIRPKLDRESSLEAGKPTSAARCRPTSVGIHAGTEHLNSRRSVATLQVEPRNERMIFRRRLQVPRIRDPVKRNEIHGATRQNSRLEGSQEDIHEEVPTVLAISVHETFTAGSSGKIERYLKFFARDETVRPVIESVSTIPWVGTCEGVEGGTLWRVVTQGLSVEYVRDHAGKRAGINLKISTEQAFGESVVSSNGEELRRRKSGQRTLSRPSGGGTEEGGASGKFELEADRTLKLRDENMQHPVDLALEPSKKFSEGVLPYQGESQMTGNGVPIKDDSPTPAVSPRGKKDAHVAPADGTGSLTPDLLEGGKGGAGNGEGELGYTAILYNRPNKIYTGWHRITGVRLHVQCFQEVNGRREETQEGPYAGNVSTARSKWRPAGRGGIFSFPPSASLQFLLCDPGAGYRTGVNVSVEDVRKNLTTDDGIVEEQLLDPGCRPALAKAIAQNLRLAFEADGSYRVILPLPATWVKAQHAG